ncbi:MAG: hypothetical protein P8010_02515 [Desulfosarcinaceae bacterium]
MASLACVNPTDTRSMRWPYILFFLWSACLLTVAPLMVLGCADSGSGAIDQPPPSKESQVTTLNSADELAAYLKEQYARSINVDLLAQNGAPETDGGRSNGDTAGDAVA